MGGLGVSRWRHSRDVEPVQHDALRGTKDCQLRDEAGHPVGARALGSSTAPRCPDVGVPPVATLVLAAWTADGLEGGGGGEGGQGSSGAAGPFAPASQPARSSSTADAG